MFGLFKSPPFSDPELGELRRARGLWRGSILLDGTRVPLSISGSRSAPDAQALAVARSASARFASWRPSIAQAMFEHLLPYAESVAAGEYEDPGLEQMNIGGPDDVWPHVTTEYVSVTPLDGRLTVEIGYRAAWDEEHTLGARLRDEQLVELCGSVLAP